MIRIILLGLVLIGCTSTNCLDIALEYETMFYHYGKMSDGTPHIEAMKWVDNSRWEPFDGRNELVGDYELLFLDNPKRRWQ